MEKLNGKAKENFQNWLSITYNFKFISYNEYNKTALSALIIEWLDTVGIYISDWGLNVVDNEIGFDCQINYKFKLISVSDTFFKTRKEAISKAIEKANQIYNDLNK